MSVYQLKSRGMCPETHSPHYDLLLNGEVLIRSCTYQEGHALALELMGDGDRYQELGKCGDLKCHLSAAEARECHAECGGQVVLSKE